MVKKIFLTATLAITMLGAVTGYAADKPLTVESIKLDPTVSLVKADQKALFTGNESVSIKQDLLNRGVLSADIYQLTYKTGETYKFGVVGDIKMGSYGLKNIGISDTMPTFISPKAKRTEQNSTSLPQLAAMINSSGANETMPYQVISPLTSRKKDLYEGVIRVDNVVEGVRYTENLYVVLYNNMYAGTSARVVAINATDEPVLKDKITPLLQVYK